MKRTVTVVCVLSLAAVGQAGIPGYLEPVPIPDPPDTSAVARDINIHSEIVGHGAGSTNVGFLWLPVDNYGGAAGLHLLPTAEGGGLDTGARGINDNGRMSGYSVRPGPEKRFSTWEMSGGATTWGDHGEGDGYKISNGGIMAGRSAKGTYGFAITTAPTQYDFLGGESAGYIHRQGTDVNNSDQTVCGHRTDSSDAVVWFYDPGAAVGDRYANERVLGKGAGSAAQALGISDTGDVVGFVDDNAAVWRSDDYDNPVILASLDGEGGTVARDVNASGLIVGSSRGKAVLWDAEGAIHDLDAMFPDVTLTEAVAINEDGNIAANGNSAYLIMVPEPATLLLLTLAAPALLRLRRKT